MAASFREYLFPPDHPRLAGLDKHDAHSHGDACSQAPMVGDAIKAWLDLFETTRFEGITSDGTVIPGLFDLGVDEGAPSASAAAAAEALLADLTEEERGRLCHSLDSKVRRAWMNPEFYVNRYGLRLEELRASTRELVLALVEASVSPEGYQDVREVMATNGFLGELCGVPKILNEDSYNVNLFGTPSATEPWGWNLYGHHLCVSCFFIGGQQVLTPVFFGAEPVEIDSGEHAGTVALPGRDRAGLELMRSLPEKLAARATLYSRKRDPAMPPGRLHPGDELHLGGAFQDNRVIPYEGVPVAEFGPEQRERIVGIVELFLRYQPEGPRAARIADVRRHLDQTWFCWIGGTGDEDVFYYRIQSPVILVEFDHHAGIWLSNTEPEPFHIHTLVRTPNGNDYGTALLSQATGERHQLDGPS